MNYTEEIIYREKILSKARKGEKITVEDRFWLATHRSINRNMGYPYLNTDIISFKSNMNYLISIKVEKLEYPYRIIPVVTAPDGKGKIIPIDMTVKDYNGKITNKKAVEVLGLLVDSNRIERKFFYQSSLGLLGISYQCDYFNEKQHIMVRGNSDTGIPNLAMIRENMSDNKIVYSCKSPNDDSFEALVFSIKWEEA